MCSIRVSSSGLIFSGFFIPIEDATIRPRMQMPTKARMGVGGGIFAITGAEEANIHAMQKENSRLVDMSKGFILYAKINHWTLLQTPKDMI